MNSVSHRNSLEALLRDLVFKPLKDMSEKEIAIRRAVCKALDDDAARLRYARLLARQGRKDAATLVREMVRDPNRRHRVRALSSDSNPWPDVPRFLECEVERGFASHVTIALRDFLEAAPHLFAVHPVIGVKFSDLGVESRSRPGKGVITLVPAAEAGGCRWPVEFFLGNKPGDELEDSPVGVLEMSLSFHAVFWAREMAGIDP